MDGFPPNDAVIVVAASVTGETPVIIKQSNEIRLISIGQFIDQFYKGDQHEGEIELSGVECLGFEKRISSNPLNQKNLYFGQSAFKSIRAVFRHKVKEVYEIEYWGGKLRATGNHSVFVRSNRGIETRAVSDLQSGDLLVELPFKANRTNRKLRQIRAHKFPERWWLSLPLWNQKEIDQWQDKYQYAMTAIESGVSQQVIGVQLGVAQTTISLWQRSINGPRALSKNYGHYGTNLPDDIQVTPKLCRLLGYYVAEGYARNELDFCFNINEKELILDVVNLMEEIFGLKSQRKYTTANAVNLVYHCAPVAKFFARLGGKGAHHKHVPA